MNTPNPLQTLIETHCTDTGETLSDIASRGGLSRQTVSAIAHRNGPGGIPRRATLASLAKGLGLSLELVERAAAMAASTADAPINDLRLAVLIDHARGLSDRDLTALVAAARVLADTRHAG